MPDLRSTLDRLQRKLSTHPILAQLWTAALIEKANLLQQNIRIANSVLDEMESIPDISIEQLRAICLLYGSENTA